MNHHTPHFTDQDFQLQVHKPELILGAEVVYRELGGKIISLTSPSGDEYCVLKLKQRYRGCRIMEVRKDAFWYSAPIPNEGETVAPPPHTYVK